MKAETLPPSALRLDTRPFAVRLERAGVHVVRYGLAAVIAWIGLMKFTAYEAGAIEGLIANSPLLAWIYGIFSVETAAILLGSAEVCVAAMIALRPVSARASAVGSALAVGIFLTTLSFLFTTPGVAEPAAGGFPAISVVPGQFLIKDVVLLGAALWSCGEAARAARGNRQ